MTKIEMHIKLQGFYWGTIGDIISFVIPCIYDDDMKPIYRPLPIDPVNPERGLWKMLKGHKTLIESSNSIIVYTDCGAFSGTDPEEALLKALISQEGL